VETAAAVFRGGAVFAVLRVNAGDGVDFAPFFTV